MLKFMKSVCRFSTNFSIFKIYSNILIFLGLSKPLSKNQNSTKLSQLLSILSLSISISITPFIFPYFIFLSPQTSQKPKSLEFPLMNEIFSFLKKVTWSSKSVVSSKIGFFEVFIELYSFHIKDKKLILKYRPKCLFSIFRTLRAYFSSFRSFYLVSLSSQSTFSLKSNLFVWI